MTPRRPGAYRPGRLSRSPTARPVFPAQLPVDESVYTEPATSGSSYRPTGGRWQYVWGTDKQQAGYYWRIGVRLDDGETHQVSIALR